MEFIRTNTKMYTFLNGHHCLQMFFLFFVFQQGSPMDPVVMKRPPLYGIGNSPYSQTQQSSPYPGQAYGPPGPQRYPMGIQGRTHSGMAGMQYPQQQVCAFNWINESSVECYVVKLCKGQ